MENIKAVDKDTLAKISAGDLYALLSICDNDDLETLVTTILSATTNSLDSNEKFKIHRPNHRAYAKEIGDELRSFGGHSFRNLFRGGGPSYEEIVIDVCKKLDVPYSEGKTVLNEERLLVNYLETHFGKMTKEDREKAIQEIRSKATSMLNNKTNLAGYAVAAIATAPLAITAGVTTAMGPAYRVTAPCVLHIAYLRKAFLESAGLDLAGAVVKINRMEEALKKAASAFREHQKLEEFILCCWAVGYAMAVCDGPASNEERDAIAEFISGASNEVVPTAVRDKIHEIRRNPPDFMGAMKFVEYIGVEAWPLIDDFLLFLAEIDGPLNEFEEDFLDRWRSYKKRKAKNT